MKQLFFNGTVITMTGDSVDAVGVHNGKIVFTGNKNDAECALGRDFIKTDLNGAVLMPAFIDSHSHIAAVADSIPELDGDCDVKYLLKRIAARAEEETDGQWIKAKNFDPHRAREKRYPTKKELDAAAPDNPAVVQHPSKHMGVFNSAGLKAVGADPEQYPDGYCEERDFLELGRKIPMLAPAVFKRAFDKAQLQYLSYGITTVQEGMLTPEMLPLYKNIAALHPVTDIIGYPGVEAYEAFKAAFGISRDTRDKFRIGGIKVILDGSPQAETAWLRTPYLDGRNGHPTMSDSDITDAIKLAYAENIQILAHCNGDAAAEQFLSALERSGCNFPAGARPVMIHAQLLGEDQMDRVKRLNVIPSFFIAHTYHWGDTHIRNLGFSRAENISPANSALRRSIAFTLHQDAPVIAPDMLETVWCAVNRFTQSGQVLGAGQRIPVKEALKAVTLNAAAQYGEQNEKGAIRPGMRADLIILSENPLTADNKKLKDIKVLLTIKDGAAVYKGL